MVSYAWHRTSDNSCLDSHSTVWHWASVWACRSCLPDSPLRPAWSTSCTCTVHAWCASGWAFSTESWQIPVPGPWSRGGPWWATWCSGASPHWWWCHWRSYSVLPWLPAPAPPRSSPQSRMFWLVIITHNYKNDAYHPPILTGHGSLHMIYPYIYMTFLKI